MDFGVITSESVGAAGGGGSGGSGNEGSEPFGLTVHKSQGSGVLKTQRSGSVQESWRLSKASRPNEFCTFSQGQSPPGLLRSGSGLSGNSGQTMISFSSQAQGPIFSDEDAARSSTFPFFLPPPDPLSSKTSGYATEKSSEGMHGPFARFRGPFTPSQWMELEHQALIYKHIMANVPVPSHLLIPLKKSFNPHAFSSFSSGSYGSNPLGWGSFHLGFAGSTDPEPGRCRRTDGKKWRCSRDAVPDQKYCERHINRGRHRSRKPVEGQNGHSVSGSTASKVASISSSSSASVISSSSASNSLGAIQHHFKNLQPSAANASTDYRMSRFQDLHGLSTVGDTINLKSKDTPFGVQKLHTLFGGSEFGIVSPDSLLNPSQKSSKSNAKHFDSFPGFSDQDAAPSQHPLRHFINNWPKDQSNRASAPWPEELKSDWTQLSMSIPMSASDFSSSSNSPRQEKPTLSPLRLAREMDPIQMGLSVNKNLNELNQKEANWLPVSWGSSEVMGGPLGEVLNSTSVGAGTLKNSSASLNLMTEMWDNSPHLGCSPTGVLQRSTLFSLSNSSSGSSPTTDNKKIPERSYPL